MAMQPISPRDDHRLKQLIDRLDRVTRELNPFLLALAFGLVVLYLTCLGALLVRLPVTHLNTCPAAAAPPATSGMRPN
jgi:hypothetical protein